MTLDPTTRESNVKDSVKKFFIDNIYKTGYALVTFDKSLSSPKVQGQTIVAKWVSINFGSIDTEDALSMCVLEILCCTRSDAEGYQLSHLRDKVVGYLEESGRIPLYRSYEDQAWEELGAMMVFIGTESGHLAGPDGTKFKRIPVVLKWGSKYE